MVKVQYPNEELDIGVQVIPERGIRVSPKNRKPPPFLLKQ